MKKLICLLLALVMVFSMVACASKTPAADTDTDANVEATTVRDDVVLNVWTEPTTLCGGFAASTYVNHISNQIFEKLLELNEDGEYVPCLAESYEFTEDNLGLIFTLRDDVYFHNGEKMTAEDVAFSYNTIIEAGYASVATSSMIDMVVLNENQVQLNFKSQYGPAVLVCTTPYMTIFPKAYYESDPEGFNRTPVGTGPYKFVEWNTGVDIKLTRFDAYWGEKPAIKDATFRILTDDSAATLALENGELDVHVTLPSADISRVKDNPNLQYSETLGTTVARIIFNPQGMFADEKLRLAVAYAIDKEAVLIGAIDGAGAVVEHSFAPSCAWVDPDYKAPSYDPEKSKQLLAEAGYPDGFELTVACSSNPNCYKPLEIVQAQLAAVGITIHIEKLESSAWFSDVFAAGKYDLNLAAFTAGMVDVEEGYALFRGGEGQNFTNWDEADLNEAFDINHVSVDPEERAEASREVVRIMGDRAIIVPLYAINNSIAANKNLKGVKADPFKEYFIADWSW